MTQPATMNPEALQDLDVIDSEGSKVAKVNVVFVDSATGRPEWAAVKTGLFGGHVTLVPLVNASTSNDALSVAYTKDVIKDAPHHDPDVELSSVDEAELLRYYGLSAGNSGSTTDEAMTRSEERMAVGKEQVATGTARLRKYIVTEQVTQTVPVSHEEIRVVHEPITEENRGDALRGGELTEEEHEIVLHAERPVVTTETVPVERVRLATETVRSEQEVTGEVRKEQIDQVVDDSKS
ncbi:MAG: PRC-barrel domain protein [Mycobacterium sp.]|nr:PRC-barrel domain protein [Mycobacterium sp.]